LVVSPLVVAEACYLIARFGSANNEAAFLRAIARVPFHLEALSSVDLERMAELVSIYADLRLGATDASVVVLGERLGLTRLATLDRRDFSVVRPRHTEAFELLPAPAPPHRRR
jgi:predicted nucleic acid-binding protein